MVPHVAARNAHQRLREFSFAARKRLLQQNLPTGDIRCQQCAATYFSWIWAKYSTTSRIRFWITSSGSQGISSNVSIYLDAFLCRPGGGTCRHPQMGISELRCGAL